MYMWRLTHDPKYREWGWEAVEVRCTSPNVKVFVTNNIFQDNQVLGVKSTWPQSVWKASVSGLKLSKHDCSEWFAASTETNSWRVETSAECLLSFTAATVKNKSSSQALLLFQTVLEITVRENRSDCWRLSTRFCLREVRISEMRAGPKSFFIFKHFPKKAFPPFYFQAKSLQWIISLLFLRLS